MSINHDWRYYNIINPDNRGDGSDGYDGCRDSACGINNDDAIVVSASNQPEINTYIIEKDLGTTPEAVIPITAVTSAKSGNPDKINNNLKN